MNLRLMSALGIAAALSINVNYAMQNEQPSEVEFWKSLNLRDGKNAAVMTAYVTRGVKKFDLNEYTGFIDAVVDQLKVKKGLKQYLINNPSIAGDIKSKVENSYNFLSNMFNAFEQKYENDYKTAAALAIASDVPTLSAGEKEAIKSALMFKRIEELTGQPTK